MIGVEKSLPMRESFSDHKLVLLVFRTVREGFFESPFERF